MNNLKVTKVEQHSITFDNGITLESDHDQDCCESHFLSFSDLTLEDFNGLVFDLSGDGFFERVADYGILLRPIKGHPISIPGYAENNGYYSANLSLVINLNGKHIRRYDITECQNY